MQMSLSLFDSSHSAALLLLLSSSTFKSFLLFPSVPIPGLTKNTSHFDRITLCYHAKITCIKQSTPRLKTLKEITSTITRKNTITLLQRDTFNSLYMSLLSKDKMEYDREACISTPIILATSYSFCFVSIIPSHFLPCLLCS